MTRREPPPAEPLWARRNRIGDRLPGLRRARHQVVGAIGRSTRRFRSLPDFLIAGAQKAGTTALYLYLRRHPRILMSIRKEAHYFDANATRGIDWYRSFFPLRATRRAREWVYGVPCVVGEATPRYMFHPAVPARVRAVLPSVRLVFVLRNPIDRAYSHFQHLLRQGLASAATFEGAVRQAEARLEEEGDDWVPDIPAYDTRRYDSILRRGFYLEQLERWTEVFPREQILVLHSADLRDRPGEVLRTVHEHIGVPSVSSGVYPAFNTARYAPMDPAVREHLAALFEPYNRRLYAWLGRDLGWDRSR